MTRAVKGFMLAETYWTLFPGVNITHLHQGDPLKCGDRVRFYHVLTHAWLHSHDVVSQLSNGLEVSGYSEANDDGNDWIIECAGEEGEEVTLDTPVIIKHAERGCYLATNGEAEYPPEVAGNWEVYCDDSTDNNEWKLDRGVFVTNADNEGEDYEGGEYEDDDSD